MLDNDKINREELRFHSQKYKLNDLDIDKRFC
jgi:hypothetical protein